MSDSVTQIINALTPFAKKLGQGGEQLYRAYYRQTIINGVESVVISLLILAGLLMGALYLRRSMRPTKFGDLDEDLQFWLIMGLILISFFGVLTVFIGLVPGVNDLLNPNYQTIQNIIGQVRG